MVKKIYVCDFCSKEVIADDSIENMEDLIEANEMVHIHKYCGYGSVFGDGSILDVTICMNCLHEIMKNNGMLNRCVKQGDSAP